MENRITPSRNVANVFVGEQLNYRNSGSKDEAADFNVSKPQKRYRQGSLEPQTHQALLVNSHTTSLPIMR